MAATHSDPSPSRVSSVSTDEESTVFKDSLQEDLGLWTGRVLPENDSAFQSLIQSPHIDGARLFEPRDQHCGIWRDAPNKDCHSSFGDQGTTASVSCYGDLIQMSQFLGVGNSGVFSIDHKSANTPYFITSRAEGLSELAKEVPGGGNFSFGLTLPKRFLPNQIPEVKWVNWKWPRYEWRVSDDSVKAQVSSQWLVKKNTVFQQIVVTNTGSSSIENFAVRPRQYMLIRDLDYLHGFNYDFNEDDSKGYMRGGGPNDFSWITANTFDKEKPPMSKTNDTIGEDAIHTRESDQQGRRAQSPAVSEEVAENKQPLSSPQLPSDGYIRPHNSSQDTLEHSLPAGDTQSAEVVDASSNQQQQGNEEQETVEQPPGQHLNATDSSPTANEVRKNRFISDTWSVKEAHAVVSIMTLYVNGVAQKFGKRTRPILRNIGHVGSSSNILEITVAYKMLVIPKGKVDWKNFLIPAEMADVSAMLAAETTEIWGHDGTDRCECSQSLCDLGLSMVKLEESNAKQDASGRGQTSHDPSIANYDGQRDVKAHDTIAIANPQTEVNKRDNSKAVESTNKHETAPNSSAPPVTGAAAGQKLSPNHQIEYLMWRHTEHILSVCAIPLFVPHILNEKEAPQVAPSSQHAVASNLDVPGTPKGQEIELDVPLALTCGDMSGHRICTSASFFAFDFLMGVLRRLPSVKQTHYIVSLQQRVHEVCRRHIKWLEWVRKPWLSLGSTETLLPSGCFAANYWVNGQIMPSESASWQPDDAVTDTPFQILKIAAYFKWLKEQQKIQASEELSNHMALLKDVWVCLIHQLDNLDKRKACAWPHTNEDGLNTYRLDDHFWVWNSLSELYDLGLWNLTDASSSSQKGSADRWVSNIYSLSPSAGFDGTAARFVSEVVPDPEVFSEFSTMARRLVPKEVQRAVLQRFTVENDVSQERMLSVTRSARDTRFFFHTRDTALFYGHKRGFFRPDTSFGELWERTIKSQSQHEEALEEEWSSPLRVALGAVVGLSGFSIDKRSSAELTRRSMEDLIHVSAHNAFIPGEIDTTTRETSIFSEERYRDYYYHVGFEACHILLAFAVDVDVASRTEQIRSTSSDKSTKNFEGLRGQMQQLLDEINDRQERLIQRQNQFMNPFQYSSDYRALAKSEADGRINRKRTPTVMKRTMPFNNMIDASSITTLDEEWLYNYPDFLMTKTLDLRHELEQLFDKNSARYRPINESVSSIIDKALESLERPPPENFPFTKYDSNKWEEEWARDGLVVSIPKQKNRRQKRGTRSIGAALNRLPFLEFNESLWISIGKARSATKAKKQFIWLPARSNPQTALLCWLASTEAEKPAMSLFFDRHAEYDNHLWDDTTMVLNTWQTELHMCFWVICDTRNKLQKGLPEPVPAPWPKNPHKELQRASIGFRFDGDFFDRYWTCHFIQYIPGLPIERAIIPRDWIYKFAYEKQSWQRKVLELQLLQHMLNLILTGSNQILSDIQHELGLEKGRLIFSVLTTEAYSSSADHWQTYEELLEKAEEDITSSLSTLSKWATREGDRGQEKPRWTRNDERKYRGYINKLRNQTERQRWELESCRDKMCKLRETLSTRQDKIRAALEANREQNIRYFTYVTIIFLPLGFASSFYSMNGAPSNDLIISLAKFAAAAFAVTAILILSVSGFIAAGEWALTVADHVAWQPLQRHSLDTRRDSLLVKGTSRINDPDETPVLHQPYPKKDWMVSSWFWPAYLLLEVPTRIVSSAWTALVTPKFSLRAVWTVSLGIFVMPIYVTSQALLISFGNARLLLRILVYICLPFTRRSSNADSTSEKKVPEEMTSEGQAQQHRPSSKETPETQGDSENIPADDKEFPPHFKQLLPTTKHLQSLDSLENKLKQRRWNI